MSDRPRIDELPEVVKLKRKLADHEEALRQIRDILVKLVPEKRGRRYADMDDIMRTYKDDIRKDREAAAGRRKRPGIPVQKGVADRRANSA